MRTIYYLVLLNYVNIFDMCINIKNPILQLLLLFKIDIIMRLNIVQTDKHCKNSNLLYITFKKQQTKILKYTDHRYC